MLALVKSMVDSYGGIAKEWNKASFAGNILKYYKEWLILIMSWHQISTNQTLGNFT